MGKSNTVCDQMGLLMSLLGFLRLALVVGSTTLFFSGCADDTVFEPHGARVLDGGSKDVLSRDHAFSPDGARHSGTTDGGDLATEARGDGCTPSCHWDCFGGHVCEDGKIYARAYAPRPCCTYDDPWPGRGPMCTDGTVTLACLAGTTCSIGPGAVPVDGRYAACIQRGHLGLVPGGSSDELLRLLCTGSEPKLPSAPCVKDADCRPADVTVTGALSCDGASAKCVESPRPDAPADYQKSCGLLPESGVQGSGVLAVPGSNTAPLCHVASAGFGEDCVRQGRTYACSFDEDCPTGSVCVCGSVISGDNQGAQSTFCAMATDRTTDDGRAAKLVCP